MKQAILANLNDPVQLEKLYRADRSSFRRAFAALYPEMKDSTLMSFWNARLNFQGQPATLPGSKDLVFVVIVSLIAGCIAKLPALLGLNEELFYLKNAGFIVAPALAACFAWKNKLSASKITSIAGVLLTCALFINLLPGTTATDTLVLSCMHLPIILWAAVGTSFTGETNSGAKRLDYLSYNGDLVVITTLIGIAGAILSAITIGLFSLIGFRIEEFYFQNIVLFALPAAPIAGTYLIQTNPQLVGRISPVIARIFSPLVLLMLAAYLAAIIYSGKNPYNNRDFLAIFNALLIGVMALIFFSVAGTAKSGKSRSSAWVLFLLSLLTIIVNGVALSAIVLRISEWGITPNRAAVLGANLLILANLLMVTVQLYKAASRRSATASVEAAIVRYLPVYVAWAAIVTFLFPFLFGSK